MRAVGNDRRAALAWIEENVDDFTPESIRFNLWREADRIRRDLEFLSGVQAQAVHDSFRRGGWRQLAEPFPEGNEDGSNRDVPPFDNDPRTDEEIKQSVYDRYDAGEWDMPEGEWDR